MLNLQNNILLPDAAISLKLSVSPAPIAQENIILNGAIIVRKLRFRGPICKINNKGILLVLFEMFKLRLF